MKITGANREQFNVSKIVKKRIRFYTKNDTFFHLDELLVIEGLSSDLNLSKTTMAALDFKWSFKDEFVQIKGEKIPLVKSGRKTELLGIERKSGGNECVELPHLNKEERVNLYPTLELEIPPNNEVNILLKAREKVKKHWKKGIETL